jgi:carboxylesterase type B
MSEIINANGNSFVAVAIQYRVRRQIDVLRISTNIQQLGAFGFLSSTEVEEDGVLNAGILDMHFALQWVQDHIGQFGGDVSRVTISGESAGGGGVMLLSIAKNGTLGTSLFSGVSTPRLSSRNHTDNLSDRGCFALPATTVQLRCSDPNREV